MGLTAAVLRARWVKVRSWLFQDKESTRDTQWPHERIARRSQDSQAARGQNQGRNRRWEHQNRLQQFKVSMAKRRPMQCAPTTAVFITCNMDIWNPTAVLSSDACLHSGDRRKTIGRRAFVPPHDIILWAAKYRYASDVQKYTGVFRWPRYVSGRVVIDVGRW